MNSFQGSTCGARTVGRYCVIVHTARPPSEEEWKQLVAVGLSASHDGAIRLLVSSDGGAPNASQRAMLTARAVGVRMIAAVLTPSVLARTASIAIRLFQPDVRILPPTHIEIALDHLDVPERERPRLRGALAEMKIALGSAA